MTDREQLVFETELDAPIEKVWRALTVPEYLERWLQPPVDASVELVTTNENESLTYRLVEHGEESFVTFELTREDDNLTLFRLTHQAPEIAAANSNEALQTVMLRAA